MKFREKILCPNLDEAAYPGNIGFEEMIKFYKLANKKELQLMEKVIDKGNWEEFKKLIKKVTETQLQ